MEWSTWLSVAAILLSFVAFAVGRFDRSRDDLKERLDGLASKNRLRFDAHGAKIRDLELADASSTQIGPSLERVDKLAQDTREDFHKHVAEMNGTMAEVRAELRQANARMGRIETLLENASRGE